MQTLGNIITYRIATSGDEETTASGYFAEIPLETVSIPCILQVNDQSEVVALGHYPTGYLLVNNRDYTQALLENKEAKLAEPMVDTFRRLVIKKYEGYTEADYLKALNALPMLNEENLPEK